MKVVKPVLGGLCQSLMGRDKGVYFVIKEILSADMVTIADGNYRKLNSPKKKKIKHLRLCPVTFEAIAQKFAGGKQVFDSEIYSALKPYNSGDVEVK